MKTKRHRKSKIGVNVFQGRSNRRAIFQLGWWLGLALGLHSAVYS